MPAGFESSTGLACLTLVPLGVTVASTISYEDDQYLMSSLSSTAIQEYESSSYLEDDPSLLENRGSSIIYILYRQRQVRRYRMDLSRIDFVSALAFYARSFFNASVDVLSQSHVPPKTVNRCSFIALLLTMLNGKQGSSILYMLGVPGQEAASAPEMAALSDAVCWMVQLLITASFLVCAAVMISTQLNPTHLVVLTGLVAMFAMECLFPVAVSVSLAMCLFNSINLVDALIVSVVMFMVGSAYARCIRFVLYPSLGHG